MPTQTTLKAAFAVLALAMLTPHEMGCAQNASALAQSTTDADVMRRLAARRRELERLQGTWQGVEAGREGEGQCKLVVQANRIRFERADKKEWYVGTITLPADKNPNQLHATISECSHPEGIGKVAMAIYKLDGRTLTLAGNAPGVTEPPTSFETDENTRTFIFKNSEGEKENSARAAKPNQMPNFAAGLRPTVQQRFEEADIALAITHYEKLQTAAFELRLKRELESAADQRQTEEWAKKEARLREEAAMLRDQTIRRAAASDH